MGTMMPNFSLAGDSLGLPSVAVRLCRALVEAGLHGVWLSYKLFPSLSLTPLLGTLPADSIVLSLLLYQVVATA
jgi:hypothetical protein